MRVSGQEGSQPTHSVAIAAVVPEWGGAEELH